MDVHGQKVQSLFSRIAGRYDLMNTVLSLNMVPYWRRRALEIADPQAGEQWLDVCCGTGKMTLAIRRLLGAQGNVVGLDFTAEMLAVARSEEKKTHLSRPVRWIEADAVELPFPAGSFDGVIIGFGLRNLPDIDRGMREMLRVLKPGGRWVCLELSHPVQPLFRQAHGFFVRNIVPRVGNLGHAEKGDYQWLPESLLKFPGAEELRDRMHQAGMTHACFKRLSGGITAVHSGMHPLDSD